MGTRTSDGILSATVVEAMRIWQAMKAQGVPLQERLATITATIRRVWPFTRAWHYLCDQCDDKGLVIATCPGDTTCGRPFAHRPHEYGTPCWCPKGDRFKVKMKAETDFISATKVRQPTRIGRR